jgi:hydrogenase 3 maturation protease
MQADAETVEKDLRIWLSDSRRVVVAGVGNTLRKDDSVGIKIVRNLKKKASKNIYLIECETTPENSIDSIIKFKPTHLLILDASLLNLKPGSFKIIQPDTIRGIPVLTHTLPINIFAEYITKTTGAKVSLLAIQPKDTDFGEELTNELRKTVEELTDLLSNVLQ